MTFTKIDVTIKKILTMKKAKRIIPKSILQNMLIVVEKNMEVFDRERLLKRLQQQEKLQYCCCQNTLVNS